MGNAQKIRVSTYDGPGAEPVIREVPWPKVEGKAALIQVGACETLLEDSTRLAAALGAANVAVTLEIWPDMIHAWPMWNAHLESGRRALAHAGEFIRRQF